MDPINNSLQWGILKLGKLSWSNNPSFLTDFPLFFDGRYIKNKRAQYQKVRESLQQRKTLLARRRLKAIGSRENRWMTDVNHQISKTLVSQYGKNTLFVLEDLTGIKNATEKVRKVV